MVGDGDGLGLTLGEGDGLISGLGVIPGVGLTFGDGLTLGEGETDGEGEVSATFTVSGATQLAVRLPEVTLAVFVIVTASVTFSRTRARNPQVMVSPASTGELV